MQEPDEKRWRFKREITTGDVLCAVAIVIPMLFYIVRVETRVSLLEEKTTAQVAAQARVDAAQDAALRESVYRIEGTVRDIQSFLLNSTAKQIGK